MGSELAHRAALDTARDLSPLPQPSSVHRRQRVCWGRRCLATATTHHPLSWHTLEAPWGSTAHAAQVGLSAVTALLTLQATGRGRGMGGRHVILMCQVAACPHTCSVPPFAPAVQQPRSRASPRASASIYCLEGWPGGCSTQTHLRYVGCGLEWGCCQIQLAPVHRMPRAKNGCSGNLSSPFWPVKIFLLLVWCTWRFCRQKDGGQCAGPRLQDKEDPRVGVAGCCIGRTRPGHGVEASQRQ